MLLFLAMLATSYDVSAAGISEAPASASAFSYDAIEPKNKRKAPAVRHGSEDALLDSSKRAKLNANARDIARNFAIAAWMIRKHLDYVSTFDFHSRTGDKGLDDAIEAMMASWARPQNCDAAGRHPLAKLLRLAEARRTVDGDVGLLKIGDGTLAGIEGDRIRDPLGQGPFLPQDPNKNRWVHGVKINDAGRALAYAIHRRVGTGSFEFERTVSAANLCLFGYFDRYDQVRGISPIAAALNPLRDTYEALDYALIKAKVTQLFALVFFRQADQSAGDISGGVDADGNEDKSGYQIDFGNGPVSLDLEPGDDAKFLESATPSTEFQNFTQVAITIALKSLDLPYSFYAENFTNFFGSRAAWMHYERACEAKWNDAIELRRKLTIWRYVLWLLDGELTLKKSQTIEDLAFEWIPRGIPFWDPSKEVNGVIQEIKAGLNNPILACKKRGTDFFDNIDQTAIALQYAGDKKVPLEFAFQPVAPVEVKGEDS